MSRFLKVALTLILLQTLSFTATAQSCGSVINTYPVIQSFEDSTNLWDLWSVAPVPWLLHTGPTSTLNTGPNAASDGDFYMLLEATNNQGPGVLLSPCFDLTSLTNPYLSLNYHLFGQDAFRFVVQATTDGGTTWSPVLIYGIGDQGPNWKFESISLSQYANETNFQLRFIGIVSDTGGNDEGDVALDNIFIGEVPTCFDISVDFDNVSCTDSGWMFCQTKLNEMNFPP